MSNPVEKITDLVLQVYDNKFYYAFKFFKKKPYFCLRINWRT